MLVKHDDNHRKKKLEEMFFAVNRVRPVAIYRGATTGPCDCAEGETKKRANRNRCYATDYDFGPRGVFGIEEHLSEDGLPYCFCCYYWKVGAIEPTAEKHFKVAWHPGEQWDHVRNQADTGAEETTGGICVDRWILEKLGVD